MLNSTRRNSGGFGIEGTPILEQRIISEIQVTKFQRISKLHHKSPSASIYARGKDWLSELQKEKSKIPSPNKYDISSKLLRIQKIAMNKSAR